MRGKLKELWHRHLDRKPWIFRDRFGLAYLFTAQDNVAEYCEQSAVIDNPAFLAWLQTNLKPGEMFVDLSPVVGGVTMLAARQVQATGAVYAFAPELKIYRQLVNNVALNQLTQSVRVIGREVLGTPTPASVTLDQFASDWQWQTVHHLRLKGAALLGPLQASAAGLFQAGRIHHVILDDVEQTALPTATTRLTELGFTVNALAAEGQLQPVSAVGPVGKLNLIATRPEAVHA
jgi:hypothetical protein